ncbi:hypothetical protein GCM10007036_42990 [Alsobacter metallidurans]|uniref:DUF3833 family protein n=1 Tax=Alsobacter metallidurans TaxID=340221 RepID=A0A917IAV2_9HYPH|nr:DUF3833 family protein [Alsobacter metallidurans]GGH31629.1 hypothetical protein GCM10007036_42990 [Alsobacter metallidurans]
MTRIAAALLAAIFVAPLPAGAAHARPMRDVSAQKLVLEDFFRGPLTAQGVFRNTRDGTQRGLKVRMNGRWDGRTLTLRENFVYSDGERDVKTWRFTKTGEGTYVGTREDVIGTADIRQDGDAVRLAYTARVKTQGGSSYNIRFADLLRKTGPRDVLNTADLSFLFFTVGTVELHIRKGRAFR